MPSRVRGRRTGVLPATLPSSGSPPMRLATFSRAGRGWRPAARGGKAEPRRCSVFPPPRSGGEGRTPKASGVGGVRLPSSFWVRAVRRHRRKSRPTVREAKCGICPHRSRNPDCAALHPGYACCALLLTAQQPCGKDAKLHGPILAGPWRGQSKTELRRQPSAQQR